MGTTAQDYRGLLAAREQKALIAGCHVLIDALFDEYSKVDTRTPESIFTTRVGKHLPRAYAHTYTPLLYKQFGICIVIVAWKLTRQELPPLACIAEELAMWTIAEEARTALAEEHVEMSKEEAGLLFGDFLDVYASSPTARSLLDPPHFTQGKRNGSQRRARRTSLPFERWFHPFPRTTRVHPYCFEGETNAHIGQAYKTCLVTPEQEALQTGCDVLIDELFEDLAQLAQQEIGTPETLTWISITHYLPSHYLPKYTYAFLKQLGVCVLTVLWKLAQPQHVILSSLAEELAGHALVEQSGACFELQQDEEEGDAMPEGEALEQFRESFFEDEDFLFLFDDSYDGIDTSIARQLLHIESLAFGDWFRPFHDGPERAAHPYVALETP